ncbi:hypothetical protein WMY93_004531 [Mugilogobius chulae]|uniref:AIG1-type G domain-containing protein n=1 Tax=Mugilogobius chulae TaxID=88201 RepID=A0AAW0Q3R0_9GOBI
MTINTFSLFRNTDASPSENSQTPHPESRSSLVWLPPDMSELTVVLVGPSWKVEPQKTETHREMKNDQTLTVVNTPDLSNTAQIIEDIKDLSAPLVFLLILQPGHFTEQQKDSLESVLQSSSEQAFERALVLLFTGGEMNEDKREHLNHPPVRDLLCRNKHLWCKDLQRDTLLTEIKTLV